MNGGRERERRGRARSSPVPRYRSCLRRRRRTPSRHRRMCAPAAVGPGPANRAHLDQESSFRHLRGSPTSGPRAPAPHPCPAPTAATGPRRRPCMGSSGITSRLSCVRPSGFRSSPPRSLRRGRQGDCWCLRGQRTGPIPTTGKTTGLKTPEIRGVRSGPRRESCPGSRPSQTPRTRALTVTRRGFPEGGRGEVCSLRQAKHAFLSRGREISSRPAGSAANLPEGVSRSGRVYLDSSSEEFCLSPERMVLGSDCSRISGLIVESRGLRAMMVFARGAPIAKPTLKANPAIGNLPRRSDRKPSVRSQSSSVDRSVEPLINCGICPPCSPSRGARPPRQSGPVGWPGPRPRCCGHASARDAVPIGEGDRDPGAAWHSKGRHVLHG